MSIDLTVAICVFNGETYITKTLESFYNQTLGDFELLVVDDCSTDETATVVKKFIEEHGWDRCSIVTLPQNIGLAGARKYAEQHIETDLILDFDADDVALPHLVERLIGVMRQQPDCMGVGCYCDYIDEHDKLMGGGFYIGPRTKRDFMEKASAEKLMFLHHPMYRRSDARSVGGRSVTGFPTGPIRYQDMCEDLDLWTRMSDLYTEGKYFIVVPEPLFHYRKHAHSMSANSGPMNERMRHIKANLKRRRSGLAELSFPDHVESQNLWRRFRNALHDNSCDHFKRAGFFYLKRQYLSFLTNLTLAAALSPSYVYQKLRSNLSLGLSKGLG